MVVFLQDFRQNVSSVTEEVGRAIIPTSTLNQILHYLPQLQNFSQELLADLKLRFANWWVIEQRRREWNRIEWNRIEVNRRG